jgi:hypothetical protein
MVKVISEGINDIHVGDLQPGQVGMITGWTSRHYLGRVVVRYKNSLITVGGMEGECWDNMDKLSDKDVYPQLRVRVLVPGTKLEV